MKNFPLTKPSQLPNKKRLDELVRELKKMSSAKRRKLFDDIASKCDQYLDIRKIFKEDGVTADFQRKFNGFYRVRRNLLWRKDFYVIFSNLKKIDLRDKRNLKNILEKIYGRDQQKRWEYAFSTKMLHTLHEQCAIMDSKVIKIISLKERQPRNVERILAHYADLQGSIAYLIAELPDLLKEFDEAIPQLKNISLAKKMDFILWRYNRN